MPFGAVFRHQWHTENFGCLVKKTLPKVGLLSGIHTPLKSNQRLRIQIPPRSQDLNLKLYLLNRSSYFSLQWRSNYWTSQVIKWWSQIWLTNLVSIQAIMWEIGQKRMIFGQFGSPIIRLVLVRLWDLSKFWLYFPIKMPIFLMVAAPN